MDVEKPFHWNEPWVDRPLIASLFGQNWIGTGPTAVILDLEVIDRRFQTEDAYPCDPFDPEGRVSEDGHLVLWQDDEHQVTLPMDVLLSFTVWTEP